MVIHDGLKSKYRRQNYIKLPSINSPISNISSIYRHSHLTLLKLLSYSLFFGERMANYHSHIYVASKLRVTE